MVAVQEMRVQSLGREDPLEKENSNPLHYSCLENPRDGGAWWAAVYGIAQSWTRLKRLSSSMHACLGAGDILGIYVSFNFAVSLKLLNDEVIIQK